MAWARSRTAMPTVVALRQRFEAIRQAELVACSRRSPALPPDARARVDEITRLIVEKLLITPTEQLKALPDRELLTAYADALSHLFALGPDDGDDERGRRRAGRAAGRPAPREFVRVVSASGQSPSSGSAPAAASSRSGRRARWRAGSRRSARPTEIVVIRTSGDRLGEARCRRRRERAASGCSSRKSRTRCSPGRVDVAVHSTKDMPVVHAARARDGAFLPRATPWDALVLPARPRRPCRGRSTAVLGGRSARRRASAPAASGASRSSTGCCRARPSSRFAATSTRGCASSTRASYDAIVLACAGLERARLASIASRLALPVTRLRAGAGAGRGRRAGARPTRRAALAARAAALDDARDACRGHRRAGRRRRCSKAAASRRSARSRVPHGGRRSSCTRRSRRSTVRSCGRWASAAIEDPIALGGASASSCSRDGAAELLDASHVEPHADGK